VAPASANRPAVVATAMVRFNVIMKFLSFVPQPLADK
jgi:hypothetical protein